jgi:hypothetical protein
MTHPPRSFRAVVPLDQLARGLMDQGFSLGPRDDRFHEYTRLNKGESQIVIFACGCVQAEDDSAAKTLLGVCGGAK